MTSVFAVASEELNLDRRLTSFVYKYTVYGNSYLSSLLLLRLNIFFFTLRC